MSLIERSEMLASLYRAQAELGVICQRSNEMGALAIYVKAATDRDAVVEAIEEFKPDSPAPLEMEFPRNKN